jgi:PEP-CTERM motif
VKFLTLNQTKVQNMNNKFFGLVAAMPLAAAGMIAFTGSAQAAALGGMFQLDGGDDTTTTLTLFDNNFTFNPNPGSIDIKIATGSFTAFNTAGIKGPQEINPGTVFSNPFLDLGQLASAGSTSDGINTFTISKAFGYNWTNSPLISSLWTGSVQFEGLFTSATGDISKGIGQLTFSTNANSLADINAALSSGTGLSNVQFAGIAVATVPEPASLLGLGIAGLALAGTRRRQAKKN